VLGSLVSPEAAARVEELVKDAVAKGAKLVTGGRRTGTVINATVLDGVTPAMRIYREESFGPVVCVVRVSGVEEAIRTANETEYGLSASVFGRDIMRALDVARRIQSGMCHINGPTVHDEAQMPFGGVKGSGYGRFGGKAVIDEFTELRWITIENSKQPYPF
jgi:acyl-CoA reductase-like NAD-dependent aldehyde dehydrogenase